MKYYERNIFSFSIMMLMTYNFLCKLFSFMTAEVHCIYVNIYSFLFAGTTLSLLGCHRIEDIREVLVGVGLQVVRLVEITTFCNYITYHFFNIIFLCGWVRVHIKRSATYLFITRSIEKSQQLLCTLKVSNSYGPNDKCCLRR